MSIQFRNVRRKSFTMVDHDLIDSTDFESPVDKMLYITLDRFADDSGKCSPSIDQLTKCLCSSGNRVRNAIKRLEDMELITVEIRKEGKRDLSHMYILNEFLDDGEGEDF